MKAFHLLCVGKLKDPHLEALENEYLKRLLNPALTIHEVRAVSSDRKSEATSLLRKIRDLGPDVHRVALTENGRRFDSRAFAHWTAERLAHPAQPVFLIAGATGFADEVLAQCQERLSLSELTFPHKLARILLVEQLYRAQTLRTGHPYHN